MAQTIQLKRAYEPAAATDGFRIYIDRLWPQGLSHETFHYDLWDKEIAPSTDLRKWFHEDPEGRWTEFEQRYKAELEANPAFAQLKQIVAQHPVVTLLYSSRNETDNNAVILRQMLVKQ